VGGRAAPGERRFLPNRAITGCPFCRGALATNVHPLEKRLQMLAFTPCAMGFFLVLSVTSLRTSMIVAVGGVLLVTSVAAGLLQWKTRSWQRFRKYEAKEREGP
jgi:hypothetical protein